MCEFGNSYVVGWKSNRVADAAEFLGAVPDDVGAELGLNNAAAKKHLVLGIESPHLHKNIVDVSRSELSYLARILNKAIVDTPYGHFDKRRIMQFETKGELAIQDMGQTFDSDIRQYMNELAGDTLIEFKNIWAVIPSGSYLKAMSMGRVAAFDIDAHLYNLDRICDEIMQANRVAAQMYSHTRQLSQEDKGYLLMCLFMADLMGRRTLEGLLFYRKIQEHMYQHELPSMAKKFIVFAYIIGINGFMLLWSLYVAGYDSNRFFNSFFYVTFACVLGQDVMIDVMVKTLYDFLIPNTIHESILYARRMCFEHMESLVSSGQSLSAFEGYSSSRYLHASHFYADTLENSVEKSFVMTYNDPLPGRTGYLWNGLEKSYTPTMPSRFAMMLGVFLPGRLLIALLLIMACFVSTGLLMTIDRMFGAFSVYLAIISFIVLMVVIASVDQCIIERRKKQSVVPSTHDGSVDNNDSMKDSDAANAALNALTPPESAEALEVERTRRDALLIVGDDYGEENNFVNDGSVPVSRRDAFLIHNAGKDEDGMPVGGLPQSVQNGYAEVTEVMPPNLELDIEKINREDGGLESHPAVSMDEENKEPSPSYRISVTSPMYGGDSVVGSPANNEGKRHQELDDEFSFPLDNDNNDSDEYGLSLLQHDSFIEAFTDLKSNHDANVRDSRQGNDGGDPTTKHHGEANTHHEMDAEGEMQEGFIDRADVGGISHGKGSSSSSSSNPRVNHNGSPYMNMDMSSSEEVAKLLRSI